MKKKTCAKCGRKFSPDNGARVTGTWLCIKCFHEFIDRFAKKREEERKAGLHKYAISGYGYRGRAVNEVH